MNQQQHIQRNSLIFARWSRKNFAIFASLGKVVKITRLTVEICDASLRKSVNLLPLFLHDLKLIEDQNDELETELNLEKALEVLPVLSAVSVGQAAHVNIELNYTTSPLSTQVMDFFILSTYGRH